MKLAKVMIGSLDSPEKGVRAQYNPKELSIEKSLQWKEHSDVKHDRPDLEFTGGGARSLTLELLFDGYERGQSVQQVIADLAELAAVSAHASKNDVRPHMVAVAWGDESVERVPPFRGVIDSIATKYTMFFEDGRPARATCTVKIKETAAIWRGR